MGNIYVAHLMVVVFLLGVFLPCLCQGDSDDDDTAAVYVVTLRHAPVSHYYGELRREVNGFKDAAPAPGRTQFNKPRRYDNATKTDKRYGSYVSRVHDSLLKKVLNGEKYLKLYSYHYLINGFAVLVTQKQAGKLARSSEVSNVVLDFSVRTATTHTPQFLGLPQGAWFQDGGFETAGEGVVIGFVDTGIDPTHPSFGDSKSNHLYPVPAHFSGICEVTRDFPSGSCNRKLVGARHFAASAITRGIFNSTQDYASPFDGDGHGTHTAAVAAGNHGIPVIVAGHHFGNASGMAPRSHIAVYKALYKSFGGFAADVVAAIDQAAQDGVDIISLSITPNRRPPGVATFFNPIDMALLSAVKAGIFVVQAAGNTGPSPTSMFSFSPWIFTVGAASHDRVYSNSIFLGNNVTIPGVGLAPGTDESKLYKLIHAHHALSNDTTVADDMYVGECQDANKFNKDLIKGNLLMCSYSIRFVLGLSTIKRASETAKNLSAAGVVFYMDPYVIGFQLNPVPMKMPGIILASTNDSKILMQYYNSSLEIDAVSKKIVKFGAIARICGGLKANYGSVAPKVMYYSARGPDPEDGLPHQADILKPNLLAPGSFIWAAWSSVGTDSVEFLGENFALMSGTSMAAPHVAGLAALIRQKFPNFSPAAIGSALSTTASLYDKSGGPIMAQRSYASPELNESPATPFDMGSGFVNASGALNPGLIFDSGYDDYMSFLCGINGSSPVVLNYTGQNCSSSLFTLHSSILLHNMALVNPFLSPTRTFLPLRVSAPPKKVLRWALYSPSLKPSLRSKHASCGATADIKAAPLADSEEDRAVLVGPTSEKEGKGEYDWTEEWYPLYLTQNVPEDAPLGLTVFDKQLVLFKDGNSQFRCYEDRCPHRLAKLSEGQLFDGRLECLYHGWQFEGEGKCVKIPQLPADAKIPRTACVKTYEVRDSQGVIWVWMSLKTPPNDSKLPWFENFARPGFRDVSTTHELPYDHSILLENLMDPAHVPISHDRTDWTAKRENAQPLGFEVTERTDRGFAGWWGTEKEGSKGNFLRFEAPCVLQNNKEFVDKNGETNYFSGLFLCRPTGQGKSMLIVRFGSTKSSPLVKVFPKWYFHQNACKVFEQDMGFLSSQNEILLKEKVPTKQLYLNLKSSDTWVAEYRKWMDKVGHGMPYYFGHSTISLPKEPAVVEHAPAGLVAGQSASSPAKGVIGTLHAPNLANRYFRHVIHCKGCRTVVKAFQAWQNALSAVAVTLVALAILVSGKQWKAILLASASLCSIGVYACSTAITMNTTNFVRTHRRL